MNPASLDNTPRPHSEETVRREAIAPVILPPNHSTRVVLVGLAAWLIGILGFVALGTGMDDLRKIGQRQMRPEGKGLMIFGMISGVLGFIVNAGFLTAQCASRS